MSKFSIIPPTSLSLDVDRDGDLDLVRQGTFNITEATAYYVDQDGKTMKFFYLGPKNNWKEMVDPKMINKIEATFQSEMKTLGYL